ncbi:MAG: DinB family protein [Chloroflexota bacterium]|nr:DinB family protein [Chloroflexota bacterium]MDE2910786.1 DinB family protein [Chloroflexota bacterium]
MSQSGTSWGQARARQIASMRLTCEILGHILRNVSAEDARALRDGPDGWSIIEIVCHLRDFDEIFQSRARMMLELDHPQLPAYDHEALAIERQYQADSLDDAYNALKGSRARFAAFFEALTPAEWARGGVHPERDSFSMTDALMQVSAHDLDHLEQITRVMAQA